MGRPLRFIPKDSLVEVTARTFQRRFLFKPSPGKKWKLMKKWADVCPENFRHKLLLMEAERARLDGDGKAARRVTSTRPAAQRRQLGCVPRGVPLEIAGKDVGHRSRRSTEVYAHFAIDAIETSGPEWRFPASGEDRWAAELLPQ